MTRGENVPAVGLRDTMPSAGGKEGAGEWDVQVIGVYERAVPRRGCLHGQSFVVKNDYCVRGTSMRYRPAAVFLGGHR